MKGVNAVGGLGGLNAPMIPPPTVQDVKVSDFSEILKSKFESIVGAKQFEEVHKFEMMIKQQSELKPKELIMYQIQASQFGLRVELLSRVGESFLNTVRKFQQGQ